MTKAIDKMILSFIWTAGLRSQKFKVKGHCKATRGRSNTLAASVLSQKFTINSVVISGKLAIAGATRNPGLQQLMDAGFHRHDSKSNAHFFSELLRHHTR